MAQESSIGKSIIAAAPLNAPSAAARFFRYLVDAALDGQGVGAPDVKTFAGHQLEEHGDAEKAITAVINQHVIAASTQGFLTNIGGFATLAIGLPANIVGLAVTHTRMVAAIAHLRGYNVDDSRTRHAILTTLLGKRIVNTLVDRGELPGSPLVVATAPGIDHELEQAISQRVMTALLTAGGGKKVVGVLAKRIPIIGGGVGAVTDGWNTHAIGAYAREQFVSRRAD